MLNGTPWQFEKMTVDVDGIGEVLSHKNLKTGVDFGRTQATDREGFPRGTIEGEYVGDAEIELATQEAFQHLVAIAEVTEEHLTVTFTYASTGDSGTLTLFSGPQRAVARRGKEGRVHADPDIPARRRDADRRYADPRTAGRVACPRRPRLSPQSIRPDVLTKLRDTHGVIRRAALQFSTPHPEVIDFVWREPTVTDFDRAQAQDAAGGSYTDALMRFVIVHPDVDKVMAQLTARPSALDRFVGTVLEPYFGSGAIVEDGALDPEVVKALRDHGTVRRAIITMGEPLAPRRSISTGRSPRTRDWEKGQAQRAKGGSFNATVTHAIIVHPDKAPIIKALQAAPLALGRFVDGTIGPFFGTDVTISNTTAL